VEKPGRKKASGSGSRVLLTIALLAAIACAGYFLKDWLFNSSNQPLARAYTSADAQSSHTSMVSALKSIGESAEEWHPYLGESQLTRMKQMRKELGAKATKTQQCELHFQLGLQEGRLGNLRNAIMELESAYELLPESDFEPGKQDFVKFKLGVAYFRLGETENCCVMGGPESCIVPIGSDGVHTRKEGSENAIRYFTEVLESSQSEIFSQNDGNANSTSELKTQQAAKWLLNVAHMTLGNYPQGVPEKYRVPESVFHTESETPKFHNIAGALGLDTFDLCGGVICDDFDNDGHLDIITSTWDPQGQLNFFRNNGEGQFVNQTEAAGLKGIFGGLNVNQTDFNDDGHLDIFVTRGAWTRSSGQIPNSLIRNNGDGTFTDISFVAGLAGPGLDFPTQVAQWSDVDSDGDLDLFVGNEHNAETIKAPCQLFRNNGDETFTDIAKSAGVENFRFTKGASFGDFDNDGDPDLYLSNLREPNRLYRNNGDRTFTDVAKSLNVTQPSASFPTWFFDFNNDGNLDLFVASYTGNIDNLVNHYCGEESNHEPSRLYQGDGKGGFIDVTVQQGLNIPMLPMGSNFGDLNNDGFLDFYLGTGDPNYESLTPNMMFLNKGGTRFEDITMGGGFGHLQKGHGVAFADLDNDGDADVFEQMGGAFLGDKFGNILFENPGFENNWLSIQLVGSQSNRAAIGAKIEIRVEEDGPPRSIWRTVNSGGSFGSNPLRQTIGIGKASQVKELRIHWPTTGDSQSFTDVEPNQFYRIFEDSDQLDKIPVKPFSLGGPK
jgi:tetratricopeptide (TPR) repeat protein